jgi:hypothetical protein
LISTTSKKYCNPSKRLREWNEKRKSDSVIFVHVFFASYSTELCTYREAKERERKKEIEREIGLMQTARRIIIIIII